MWNPKKIIVNNFLSHPHSEFTFPKDKLTMIFGKNEDDNKNGANSNGSGKSVLIEAVTVALTGETYRDINKDDFLLDGEDEGYIDFYLTNSFNKENLRILWEFKRNSSSKVKIFENDSKEHLKKITSVNEAKKFILEKIGISREDLLNFFIINQGNSNSFFTAGDVKQKEIIGRFANYDIVNKVIDEIKLERDSLTKEQQNIQTKISSQESIIESMNELIEQEQSELLDDSKEIIQELLSDKMLNEKEIEGLKTIIPGQKEYLEQVKGELKTAKLEKSQFEEILSEVEEIKELQNSLKKEKRKLELKKSELQSSLEHAITCPSCKHEFLLDSEKSIEELEKDLSENTELLISNKKSIAENEELISESESHEEAFKLLKEEVKKLERKVSNIESEIEDNETEIVRIEKKNKSIDETISDLKEVKEKTSNIPTYKEKIVEATQKIDDLTIESKKVSKDIEDKDYWLIHLGKKGFQTFLANKCISVIQNLCNKYLEEMKVNLRVKINGYKITSSGELRDKIEVLIVKDEEVEAKFNRFSGGQKERINLAGILTFHNLINSSLNGKGLNLLCLDESLDYLDEKGQKVCLNILQLFDLTTFVISHNSVENLVEDYNKILVKYSNGKSKIETNE